MMKLVKYTKTSHILYYCLVGIFALFLYISQSVPSQEIEKNILIFYAVLLLPLWDMLWDMIGVKEIGKIFFALALGVFCFVALYLALGVQDQAEKLSIWAYYFLLLGVLSEIIISLFFSKKHENS